MSRSIILSRSLFFCMPLLFCVVLFFTCASPALALPPQEETRITTLLDSLGTYSDVKFIRDGSLRTAKETAAELKQLLKKTKNSLSTAEEFVDKATAAASVSKKPYGIRTACGQEDSARAFLLELLQQVAPK